MAKLKGQIDRLKWARLSSPPAFDKNKKYRGAAKLGIVYEQQVLDYLEALYTGKLVVRPWLQFEDFNGAGLCQPDALILPAKKGGRLVVVEIKLTYMASAKRKFVKLYQPVVAAAYPGHKYQGVQICKRLKPSVCGPMLKAWELRTAYDYGVCHLRKAF